MNDPHDKPSPLSVSDADRNPVEVLAEEFAQRCRQGSCPSVSEYARKYPEHADEIRELFPSIGMIEQLRRKDHAERELLESRSSLDGGRLQRVGEYDILREIGRGGMGVVFEARQKSLGRRVALKVLASGVRTPKQLLRFRREATAAARLHHTNIVPVFGVGEHDDLHYYVMQFIDGVPLNEVLEALRQLDASPAADDDCSRQPNRSTTFSAAEAARALLEHDFAHFAQCSTADDSSGSNDRPSIRPSATPSTPQLDRGSADTQEHARSASPLVSSEATSDAGEPHATTQGWSRRDGRYWTSVARIGLQVARALEYAHDQGVLHRDIKPANLLLDAHGAVWITDFGLAKLAEHEALTNSGDVVGTLRYMAPEQFDGRGDERSDIYSLGLTLYELLTLAPADQVSPLVQFARRQDRRFPAATTAAAAIPRDLETIVLKATTADPENRYAGAGELAEDLQRLLDDRPILARRASIVERLWRWGRRNPLSAALTASTLVLLVLVAVVTSISAVRTRLALAGADEERQKAQSEHVRAEANLDLAMEAFQSIIERVSSRGLPQSLEPELDGEESPKFDAAITAADAELLQSLLKFYAEFAARNKADVQVETAQAHRRIGDIRARLGQFDPAEAAYRDALALYRALAGAGPGDVRQVVAQAEVLNSLGDVQAKKGQIIQALKTHEEAQVFLSGQPQDVAQTKEVRFELAQTLNLIASVGPRSGMFFSRGGPPHHGPPPRHDSSRRHDDRPPPNDRHRDDDRFREGERGRPPRDGHSPFPWSRIKENHRQALELLHGLINEDPANAEYQLALSRCHRNYQPIAWMSVGPDEAAESMREAVEILDRLVAEFPSNPRFRFELADTLSTIGPPPPGHFADSKSRQRLERAVAISQELAATYPGLPEYRALVAGVRAKLASFQRHAEELEAAAASYEQALVIQTQLVEQYSAVPAYHFALARWSRELAEIHRAQGKLADSRQTLESGLADFEAFVQKSDPENPFYRRVLGGMCHALADTLHAAGENELADQASRRGREFDNHSWSHGHGFFHRGGERPTGSAPSESK